MCKINPKVDFAFKKLFGSENNKDLTISLINSIVKKEDRVRSITLKNPYNLQAYQTGKMSILDIKAESETGKIINIEMQIGEDYYYDQRAIYYWAKLLSEQIEEGQYYKELQKTISINFLDFNFLSYSTYHNSYKILNETTLKDDFPLKNLFEMHIIELRKFTKTYPSISNSLDRWITFLNNAYTLDKNNLPNELKVHEIQKATTEVDKMFDEEERTIYDNRKQNILDEQSRLAGALEEGEKKGREEGREEGEKKGREEGEKKGREEGQEENAIAIASQMLLANEPVDKIVRYTNLSKKKIEDLKKKNKQ